MEGVKQTFLAGFIAISAVVNEVKEAADKIDITTSFMDFLEKFSSYLSWQEITLEAIVFPIAGLYIIKLYNRIMLKRKSVEEIREQIDKLNEDLKQIEKK